jgi:hypothetical protein
MTFTWQVVIAVGVGIALVGALVLGRRRRGGKVRGVRRRTPVPPRPTAGRPPTGRRPSPPKVRQPPPEFVVVGARVRVTATSSGLVVYRQQGSSWTRYVGFGWSEIDKAYFTAGTYDPLVALYATTSQRKHHLVDSRQLTSEQWGELASAVAAWTSGRVVIDLSGRADPRSVTDI